MTENTHGFTITRTLSASPDEVYRAWTDPSRLGWFFNRDTTGDVDVDLRVGGIWRQTMIENADTVYVTGGVYRELVPGERIVFTWGAVGGWPELDLEHPEQSPLATVVLTESGDRTVMTFRLDLPPHFSADEVQEWLNKGIREGWTETIDRLADVLAVTLGGAGGPTR